MATPEDEDLTTFRTRFGSFKYTVMPFGLTNGPATYQHFMNDILFEYLDRFVTAYLDDILIYSEDLKTHKEHVRTVLQCLQKADLQADITKCEFHITETQYLGLIITNKGIRMNPNKISTITNWQTPTKLCHVRAFIRFASFYRRFIKNFSKIIKLINNLTLKD